MGPSGSEVGVPEIGAEGGAHLVAGLLGEGFERVHFLLGVKAGIGGDAARSGARLERKFGQGVDSGGRKRKAALQIDEGAVVFALGQLPRGVAVGTEGGAEVFGEFRLGEGARLGT
ncbi:hypothetical protein EBR16_09360, partial [bacterium]|nr:hypothetical protein [bacterium]